MLTIFAIPKPFGGHIGVIQRNAIRSWLALRPGCQVILFGDDDGVASCAREFGAEHVPDVARSDHGTPLLHEVFALAEQAARFPRLCYVNADIILPRAFTACVGRIALPAFLMVGQRVDVDVTGELDLADPERRCAFEQDVANRGTPHPQRGSDYFVFSRGAMGALPPFAVGRPGWDNWMIFRARQMRLPVVDASRCTLVVHQNHAYEHVPLASGELWEGPEADMNRRLVSPEARRFTPRHATWRLDPEGLRRQRWWSRDRGSLMHEAAVLHPWTRPLLPAANSVLQVLGRKGPGRSGAGSQAVVQTRPSAERRDRSCPGLDKDLLKTMWPPTRQRSWMAEPYEPGLASVIVPTCNRAVRIKETLDSVGAQTYRPIEIVVVDDGSTDATGSVVEEWRAAHAAAEGLAVRFVQQSNHGAADARNHGLVECRGEYVQFLDSDDLLHPEGLARHARCLAGDPAVDYVYSGTGSFSGEPDWNVAPFAGLAPADDRLLLRFLCGGLWNTISGLYRRSACAAVGPWDEHVPIFQDWDYNVRFLLGSPTVRRVEGVLSLRRSGAGDRVTARRLSEEALRGRYEQTVTWVRRIRAAGMMDTDVEGVLATRVLGAAWLALANGRVDLAREITDWLRGAQVVGGPTRSRLACTLFARSPRWCGPRLARLWMG